MLTSIVTKTYMFTYISSIIKIQRGNDRILEHIDSAIDSTTLLFPVIN